MTALPHGPPLPCVGWVAASLSLGQLACAIIWDISVCVCVCVCVCVRERERERERASNEHGEGGMLKSGD